MYLHEWEPQVLKTLNEIGFLELLDARSEVPDIPDNNEFFIEKLKCGTRADAGESDEIVMSVNRLLNVLREQAQISLNSAVGEAMSNCALHAYPDWHSFRYPVTNQWWLTGFADRIENSLTVSVYDQGVTIPVHLPRRWGEQVLDALRSSITGTESDGDIIMRATKMDRSGTGKSQHGKGFQDMKTAIDAAPWGRLRILSRRGEYIYYSSEDERCYTRDASIGGTLIEWQIAMQPLDVGARK